jgi:transcriptional regulator with XRE-family HTH domain
MPPRKTVSSVHRPRYRAFLGRLKEARVAAKLTQAEVAAALGRPQSFVAKCESGERRVDVVELEQFAKLYRRTVAFFLSTVR